MKSREKSLLEQLREGKQEIVGILFFGKGCILELVDATGETELIEQVSIQEKYLPFVENLIEKFTGFNIDVLIELAKRTGAIRLCYKWTPAGFCLFGRYSVVRSMFDIAIPSKTEWMTLAEFKEWLDRVEICAAEYSIPKSDF